MLLQLVASTMPRGELLIIHSCVDADAGDGDRVDDGEDGDGGDRVEVQEGGHPRARAHRWRQSQRLEGGQRRQGQRRFWKVTS